MHDHLPILQHRLERTLRERIWPRTTSHVSDLRVGAWSVPAEGGHVGEPVSLSDAMAAEYHPITVGTPWGKPWETVWFQVDTEIPSDVPLASGDRLEIVMDLGWQDHSPGFQAEGLVRDEQGVVIKAINPRNQWIPVPQQPGPARFWIEAAANPLLLGVPPFIPTDDGDKLTSGQAPIYRLARAELVVLHHDAYHLALDLAVLSELAKTRQADDPWAWKVWLQINDALDALDLEDVPGTAGKAREILQPLMSAPALPDAQRVSAVGHAHIDSAWLWPIRETRRKVTRTYANVVRLIEDKTGLIFALPGAQHMAWLEEEDPELFERVKRCVAEGSIVPVGGMWIEPDAVLPGGEAMCRQLVEGLGYFEEKFGVGCQEIWLPDSFGYSAAIPQLAKLAGIDRFLTQKISWNQIDVFPHHTLWWEGIDGSRVFTHFPPCDTYGAEMTGDNLARTVHNSKDKGRTTCSLVPFGYGDGGGGPTREMMERIHRYSDMAGSPQVVVESPKEFFDRAQEEFSKPPVWVGELYLELHRGTFTSQIRTKQGNRRSESLLREAELWATVAATQTDYQYPYQQLQSLWHDVLLCQFHDILPGTSIAWVYREVHAIYDRVARELEEIIADALRALGVEQQADGTALANATSFAALGAPALGIAEAPLEKPASGERLVLDNGIVRAQFDEDGCCTELIDLESGRNYIPAGQRAGELHLHQDFPNMWDAWDVDYFYRGSMRVLDGYQLTADGTSGEVSTRVALNHSEARLTWTLPAGARSLQLQVELDWHESEKFLKLAFPVDVHADHAQYETQMGHVMRTTHENTTWDALRFEVNCHRWLRISDAASGIAIANDATYGWDVTRHPGEQRGTWSMVRASLARAAKFPDPHQDQGTHTWHFALAPGASVTDAVREGQHLNVRPRRVSGAVAAPFTLTGAVVESVAMCPDQSGDVVIRAYEATGAPGQLRLRYPDATSVEGVDLRYRSSERGAVVRNEGDEYVCDVAPFEIVTLRVRH